VTIADWRLLGAPVAQPSMQMNFGFAGVALSPRGRRLRMFAPA
jgi:hypothetical protein